jgi:hypothetical protein
MLSAVERELKRRDLCTVGIVCLAIGILLGAWLTGWL